MGAGVGASVGAGVGAAVGIKPGGSTRTEAKRAKSQVLASEAKTEASAGGVALVAVTRGVPEGLGELA